TILNNSYYDYQYYSENNSKSPCDSETVSNFTSVFLPLLYSLVFILGFTGNAMVLWVLLRHIKLKTVTDVCLLNLASSDLIFAASLPLWVTNSQSLISCKVITGVYQLGLYSGTLFVTFMSVDRYLAIVHAVAAMRARSFHYGIIISIIIWSISIVMAIPQVIFANMEEDDSPVYLKCGPLYPDYSVNFWKKFRNFSENIVTLLVCLPIMLFCYIKILIVLSKARNSNRYKAVKLILIIVCMFVICWVPYNLIVFLQTLQLFDILNTCLDDQKIYASLVVSQIFALLHCCVNPIIYAFVGEKFRKSVSCVLLRCIHKREQKSVMSSHKDTTEKETTNTVIL
uniref:G-protein coupled receptors family 1 profile domain-containing protein n=1 Tax=Periophthalmus magnuspinnatus TaxID=409849 RepID=A0A3B3ZV69_9GOBI